MSLSYGQFAYVYDKLMTDVPYEEWVHYFKQQLHETNKEQAKVLDLACGTGEISIRLAREGFDVTGVDLSDDMLMVAREKAERQGVNVPLYQQDMCDLDLGTLFDCIVIFCDSLNYLSSEEDIQNTFAKVYEHLKPGGLFLFDVHSTYKVEHIFAENTYTLNEDDVSYIWNCFKGSQRYSVEHDITFFVYEKEIDAYYRFDELHKQRTFPIETYKSWLKRSGLELVTVTADFQKLEPSEESERIFFSARKPLEEGEMGS